MHDTIQSNEGSLLWTLEEIGRLVSGSGDPAETLDNVVHLIQRRFDTQVCSVYLLEPDRSHLVLAATIGLRPDSVGRVRMPIHEGLAGLVAEELRPQLVSDAASHPRFKYFPDAGEDAYRSFLGVPVIDRGLLQGVLVVQTVESRTFPADEVRMLTTAGAQLAPIVSEARRLKQFVAPAHQKLQALARNLWWSWDDETTGLFRQLDPVLWRELGRNPIALLQRLPIETLEERAAQLALHSRIDYAYRRLREYLADDHTWGARHAGVLWARPVAYFSAEFGLHESIPIYSGGLGILAGDHIKSASDLGVPLIGVGLYYDQGYFRQRLDAEGWQHEDYIDVDSAVLPLELATSRGVAVTITIETRTGPIHARVWKLAVGRNTLLLLDSNVDGNHPEDRELTARLYGGDHRIRIRQELLLGVGGVRALHAMGIFPGVVHLNEGHSAFASLELTRHRMTTEGIDAHEAIRRVAPQVVFTTHTPVPAGHDRFSSALVEEHLGPLGDSMALDHQGLMALGRVNPHDHHEEFCMTVLALKLSRRANAVSSLHGQVSRAMWAGLYPGCTEEQVPIGHITNGVHVHTWLAPQMRQVYDRHFGPDWPGRAGDPGFWEQIDPGRRWRAVGDPSDAQGAPGGGGAAARGRPRAAARRDPRDHRAAAARPQLRRVDDRLRPPLRDLQARGAAVPGRRRAGGDGQRCADAGAVRLRGQVASARPSGQEPAAADLTPGARSAIRRQDRVPRGLRHQRRADAGAGRRRLGQQPAAAARGLRHQRAEDRPERRPQHVDPRRLVGGMRTTARTASRLAAARPTPTSRCTTRATATRCCGCSGTR